MSKTISTIEPAERPYNLAISDAEILALIKHHNRCVRKLANVTGKFLTQGDGTGPFKIPTATEARIAIKVAKEAIAAHGARARGLISILKK